MGTMTELIKHWKREGIAVAAGNTEAALAAFDRQNAVKLPAGKKTVGTLSVPPSRSRPTSMPILYGEGLLVRAGGGSL